ncbi:DUF799 family lipoprotein [bacterium]|nr:DUF799 family lipoprotein [bacterium]
MKSVKYILLAAVSIMLFGCAKGAYENIHEGVVMNARDQISLAVQPKYTTIAVMPFINNSGTKNANTYARRSFFGNLVSYKNWNVQPMAETDNRLAKATRRELDESNAGKMKSILGCDLVCYGEVKEQCSRYGLVFSYNSVTARVAFYDASTGAKVWEAEDFRDSLVMGISFIYMYEREVMWAREVHNRYDELFRDMMQQFPMCTYGYKTK